MNLNSLYERSINHYQTSSKNGYVVNPSIPILYFGNLRSYQQSELRIVTAGLNPSDVEFKEKRFSISDPTTATLTDFESELSNYFRVNPYSLWFNRSFERLLQSLDSSFYGQSYPKSKPPTWWKPRRNTALHTDIGTPLATTPTWSQLPRKTREELQQVGFSLWADLIEMIKPHVVLISVAQSHLARFGNVAWRSFRPLESDEDRHEMRIGDFLGTKIVWGRSQVTPFFHFKEGQLESVARSILFETGLQL